MTAKVELLGMKFHAYHGCFDIEKELGNEFVVDVVYEYFISEKVKDDNLADAVDYAPIYNIVKEEMAIRSNLLENVAWRIKKRIAAEYSAITKVTVSVVKMHPPVSGPVEWSKVTI